MSESAENGLLLRNARVVLPNRVVEGETLLVKGELISSISSDSSDAMAQQLDLKGATLFPGFIDIHIHGAIGVDTMEATAADLERVSQFLASKGVTGWLPTLVPAPVADYERAIRAIAECLHGSKNGARVLGVHYEGPFVNSLQCGALRSQFFRAFSSSGDLSDLPKLPEASAGHLMTIAPEIDGGIQLVEELKRNGWIVSLGHTRASVGVLEQALAAGAHHMTHFMNAMSPLHHRAPGPVGWGLLRDEVTCDVIADGVHLDLAILRLLLKCKSAERLMLVSDAIAAAGQSDGDYKIWGETISVKDGRTSNASGHIAGSVITMLDAVKTMSSLGVAEIDLARMASLNPARLLGIDGECGSIEEGKRADLVALDARGNPTLTVIGGRIVMSAEC